jgi:hypothetical protein
MFYYFMKIAKSSYLAGVHGIHHCCLEWREMTTTIWVLGLRRKGDERRERRLEEAGGGWRGGWELQIY